MPRMCYNFDNVVKSPPLYPYKLFLTRPFKPPARRRRVKLPVFDTLALLDCKKEQYRTTSCRWLNESNLSTAHEIRPTAKFSRARVIHSAKAIRHDGRVTRRTLKFSVFLKQSRINHVKNNLLAIMNYLEANFS